MSRMLRLVAVGIMLVAVSVAGVLFAAEATEAPQAALPFTVVTQECGVADIVADNYRAFPKWWISGVHFVDLDGDGDLDFYMSSHGRFDPTRGMSSALASLNDGHGHFSPRRARTRSPKSFRRTTSTRTGALTSS